MFWWLVIVAISLPILLTSCVGETGPMGPVGPQGEKGEQGITGEQGPMGIQGKVGPKGDRGEVGPQGIQGREGLQGSKGAKGDVGSQGPQGEKGERGEQGIPGRDGQVITITPESTPEPTPEARTSSGIDPSNWTSEELAQCEVEDGELPTTDCERAYVLVMKQLDEAELTALELTILLPHILNLVRVVSAMETFTETLSRGDADLLEVCAEIEEWLRDVKDAIEGARGLHRAEIRGYEVQFIMLRLQLERGSTLCATAGFTSST